MTKAIERAKAIRPRVRVISADARTYSVTGSKGDVYTVKFAVANGLKLAECDCKAGQRGQMCFHVAAAASINIAVQSQRQAAPAPAAPLPVPTVKRRPSGWYGQRISNAMIVDGWAV
ncbi:MAG: hypothetical protein AB7U82_08260 [Blastocatellales bacterium]